jgi:hypothetical protein
MDRRGARSRKALGNSNRPCHCEIVKKITVSIDDEAYRRARIKAAEQDTSVSALVKRFLCVLASEEGELRARISSFSARDRLRLDGIHDRGA